MNISLIEWPDEKAWENVKRRALITIGKTPIKLPDIEWKRKILESRHSPIRYLRFSFLMEGIPYCYANHLARHVHAQPYIKTERNDRQNEFDREKAPQGALVDMIWDCSGEEMMIVANKRLCQLSDKNTREIVKTMCWIVEKKCPEFKGFLVPMCEYHGGICHEMYSCGKCDKNET